MNSTLTTLFNNKKEKQKNIIWLLYVIPALGFYVFFMAFLLLKSLILSFFTGSGFNQDIFIGFDNYIKLFTNPHFSERFISAFVHTWYFFLIHMIVQNILGLFFANILMTRGLKGKNIYRTIIFIPATLAILVTGYLWSLILNPQWGALNIVLKQIGLEQMAIPWLGNTDTALASISLVSSWQWVGMPTMMFIAGLQTIPDDLYEAANIAGATPTQIFWYIKLPLLKPIIGIVAVLTFVNNFNAFDVVFAMENVNGAPMYSTDILGTLFYRVGIAGEHPIGIADKGLGASIATITFIILIIGVLIIRRMTNTNTLKGK